MRLVRCCRKEAVGFLNERFRVYGVKSLRVVDASIIRSISEAILPVRGMPLQRRLQI